MPLVLVVDDAEEVLDLVGRYLRRKGFEVITSSDAQGARAVAMAEGPDVIVLDLDMPGMTGDAVAALLMDRELTKSIPIVFYSSVDEGRLREMTQRFPGSLGVSKAGGVKELHGAIARLLDGQA